MHRGSIEEEKDETILCNNPDCLARGIAVKICHHYDCKNKNSHQPLALCAACDTAIHNKAVNSNAGDHLRFAVLRKVTNLSRNASIISTADSGHFSDEDQGAAQNGNIKTSDIEEEVIAPTEQAGLQSSSLRGLLVETGIGLFPMMSRNLHDDKRSSKLKRGNAVKHRHSKSSTGHGASQEYFTLKFHVGDQPDIEVVAAVQGQSLRDAITPIFEKKKIGLDYLNFFLESSRTPLPLHIDSFPLGGHIINVKEHYVNRLPPTRQVQLEKEGDTSSNRSIKSRSTSSQRSVEKKPATTTCTKQDFTQSKSKSVATLKPPPEPRRRNSLPLAIRDWFLSTNEANAGKSPPVDPKDFSPNESESLRKNKAVDDSSQEKQSKAQNRLGNLFSPAATSFKDREKLEQLYEKLQIYNLQGLPEMPDLLMIGRPKFDPSLYELEEHWTDIVDNHTALSERERNHQAAVWELIQTEVTYIKGIGVIIDVFLCCMVNLQNSLLLNDIETDRLFSNIVDVIGANRQLWEEHMLPVVEEARQTRQPLSVSGMKEGFLKFNDMFQPYLRHCLDQEGSVMYLRDSCRDNELFKIFVSWAETQKQCERLRLQDQIVKPMQRLTKYSLLLSAINKKTENPQEKEDLETMIISVDIFVNFVNTTLRKRHEKERLATIIDRIESYDVVDILNEECSKILNDYTQLDLTCPMPGCNPQQTRHLLCEGALRFKDGISKSTDAYCFLFTDMFLITKASKRGDKDKVKIIKPPIRIDQVIVHELKDGGSFLVLLVNEYRVAWSAYTFHGEQIKLWVGKIQKAQALYQEARLRAQYPEDEDLYYLPDEFDDDSLNYPTAAMMNMPGLKPSISHENLSLRRTSCSESDFNQFNISRAKSTECLLSRPESVDSLTHNHHKPGLDRRYDSLPPKTHSFNQTVSDEEEDYDSLGRSSTGGRGSLRSDGSSPFPRRRSVPKDGREQGHTLAVPDVNILPPSRSPPASPSPVRRKLLSMQRKDSPKNSKSKSLSVSESISSSGTNSPSSRMSPVDSRGVFGENPRISLTMEDNGKGKFNQRRSDKRYHTVDSIENVQKKDRDASIHKRLSWNLGALEVCGGPTEDERTLQESTGVSTSLRSVVSSSGFSSTGSLQANQDPDHRRTASTDSVFENSNEVTITVSAPLRRADRPQSTSALQPPSLSLDSAEEALKTRSLTLPHQSASEDGISFSTSDSSLATTPEGRKRMTHSQMMRLKKQLLLSSDLEASEV
ncbi:pleckstrin homology domain-containing family G member 5-like isoform X3 [Lineus longissimus]|uniref:pleckstrin homology domain-containing family G member 5-like isoform X3 n=1 Tax=Lineus longissimus TaxID=88925 RepID=UPI00315CDB2E